MGGGGGGGGVISSSSSPPLPSDFPSKYRRAYRREFWWSSAVHLHHCLPGFFRNSSIFRPRHWRRRSAKVGFVHRPHIHHSLWLHFIILEQITIVYLMVFRIPTNTDRTPSLCMCDMWCSVSTSPEIREFSGIFGIFLDNFGN